jgi:hypothetical protein
MQFINLTGKLLTIYSHCPFKSQLFSYPSGHIEVLFNTIFRRKAFHVINFVDGEVDLHHESCCNVLNLPPERKGIAYIVSREVRKFYLLRLDLYSPGIPAQINSIEGLKIVGNIGLVSNLGF